MGKRKERRLAAMAAAGRRVKLDLFVDPSPGEASLQEGVRGDLNRDEQTGVPASPSSSDKKENPLALLGQYSDDGEGDEEEADQPNGAIEESPTDASAEAIHEHNDSAGDKDCNSELPASVDVQQEATQANAISNHTDNVAEDTRVAPEPAVESESAPATQVIPDSSSMQIVGDAGGNWKAVMHGQSNQCYYWNTVTGETSWEMPNELASGVAADGFTSASVVAHLDYAIEAQAHVLPHNTAVVYPSDLSVGNSGTTTYAALAMDCGNGQLSHDAYAYSAAVSNHESMDIDPLQLVKYGDDLLQRLKLLERLHDSADNLGWLKREVEIRISDCSTLSSYGSSLLPLWLHVEVHLKQLESSISKLEASYCTEPRHEKTEAEQYKATNGAEVMASSTVEDSKSDVHPGISVDENNKIEEPSSTSPIHDLQEKEAAFVPSKVESDNGDEDMDVEMEVDEENVEGRELPSSMCNREPPPEHLQSSNLSSLEGSPPTEADIPPPPLEEEWVPPPPPESEPVPPPPPEEPVVSYSLSDTVPLSYQGQANFGYTPPGIEYYGSAATEGTNASCYIQASESHILQPQQPSYYVPVSASGISVPVDATHVAPVSYYSYSPVTSAATVVAAELSGYYATSVAAISSDTLDNRTSSASLMSVSSNVPPVRSDEVISKEAQIASSQPVGTISQLGSSSQVSTTTTNQTKVVRSKKRTVAVASSLRSNKKVSSLVDKWKAAKEELRDEEDEPESALEALERKRQKEINEWHKQQIASGEAQENANFVPLGGNWRERIKRRRAEAKIESKRVSSPGAVVSAEQHRGQPDLADLSKGLPSGWQAYLDESTKQVYYGNSLTSETTWDRPTN